MLHTMMLVFCTIPLDRPVTPRNSFMEKVCQSWQWGKNKLHEMAVNSVSKTDVIAGAAMCAMYYGWSQYQEQQPELENALADYVAGGATLFGMALSKNFYASTVALAALLMPKVTACQPILIGSYALEKNNSAGHLAISETTAFISGTQYLLAVNISNPKNMMMLGKYYAENHYGSGVAVLGSTAYFVHGDSLSILNASNPSNMRLLSSYATVDSRVISASEEIVYLSSRRDDRSDIYDLDIIDVSFPKKPKLLTAYSLSFGTLYFTMSGNIACYPFSFRNIGIFDISNKTNPQFLSEYKLEDDILHEIHTLVVSKSAIYAVDSRKIFVIDINDPKKPLLSNTYNAKGIYPIYMVVSGNLGIIAGVDDEVGGLTIVDLYNPKNITVLGKYNQPSCPDICFYKDIAISGKTVFLLDEERLRAFDISSCL